MQELGWCLQSLETLPGLQQVLQRGLRLVLRTQELRQLVMRQRVLRLPL